MNFITFPVIEANSSGIKAFDMSPMGYSYETAILFLNSLNSESKWMYLYVQEILDVFLPFFQSCFYMLVIYKLSSKKNNLFLIGLLPIFFDYTENIFVIIMLTNEKISEFLVMIASSITILKPIFNTTCYFIIIFLLSKKLYIYFKSKKVT